MSSTAFKNTTAPKIWPTTAHKVPIHRPSAPNLRSPTTPTTIRPTRNLHPHSPPGYPPPRKANDQSQMSTKFQRGLQNCKITPHGGFQHHKPAPGGSKIVSPPSPTLELSLPGGPKLSKQRSKARRLIGCLPPTLPPHALFSIQIILFVQFVVL